MNLPQTGQTKCFDTYGNEVPCSGTGQDGEMQAGFPWPSPRFIDQGNGTVTDNLTGLMWAKNADLPNRTKTWQQALDYVAGMNAGNYPNFGYTDWRLPNRKELHSLTDFSQYNPAIPAGHPFTNVQADIYWPYWSSSTRASDQQCAWYVYMLDGEVNSYNKFYDYGYVYGYVWPVRAGSGLYSITGTITGEVIEAVTMLLSGSISSTTLTDSLGRYSFKNLHNGNYTVTPTKSCYSFTPSTRSVVINGSNTSNVDFISSLCIQISPVTQSFASAGGTGYIDVTPTTICNWTAQSNASWIIITSGNSGTGSGTVYYSVNSNTSPCSRTGNISFAEQIFTVTQSGIACAYSLSPASQTFSTSGGAGYLNVTTESCCNWASASNVSWITVTSGSSGISNGVVKYLVSANAGSQRTGTITIAGQTFTVTQEGSPTAGCAEWNEVIEKYQTYISGQAGWDDVITCYNQYVSS
ncbi:MAG: DUF1566 domain-containing protein [Proteobacteria bacterium]|nr:DUF1566 domain-containing protein [Pseudomonadota bacterium]